MCGCVSFMSLIRSSAQHDLAEDTYTTTGSVKNKTTTVFSRFFNTCQKSEQTQIIKNVELFKIRILIYDVVYVIFAPS